MDPGIATRELVSGSTSTGGVGKYLKARTAGSVDVTANGAIDDSGKKRSVCFDCRVQRFLWMVDVMDMYFSSCLLHLGESTGSIIDIFNSCAMVCSSIMYNACMWMCAM
jgi:hypothetical protein